MSRGENSSLHDGTVHIIGAGMAALVLALFLLGQDEHVAVHVWPKHRGYEKRPKRADNKQGVFAMPLTQDCPTVLRYYAYPLTRTTTGRRSIAHVESNLIDLSWKQGWQINYSQMETHVLAVLLCHYGSRIRLQEPGLLETAEHLRAFAGKHSESRIVCADGSRGLSKTVFFGFVSVLSIRFL